MTTGPLHWELLQRARYCISFYLRILYYENETRAHMMS
jgi:hypothetical protein